MHRSEISPIKDRTLIDCDFSTKDKSLHDSQITSVINRTSVDSDSTEHNCEMLSPDCSTIEQLQEFIDASYQKSLLHQISLTQATDSSTPLKLRPDCSLDTLQDQFNAFKHDMETKVLNLLTKTSEQTQIIDKNHQELCRLTKNNLHLKSRLTQLEEKVSPPKTLPLFKFTATIKSPIQFHKKITNLLNLKLLNLKPLNPMIHGVSPPPPSSLRET